MDDRNVEMGKWGNGDSHAPCEEAMYHCINTVIHG